MLPLHQGMFGQPSQSSVGMGNQSNVLVEKWKRLLDLKREHQELQVLNIQSVFDEEKNIWKI